MKGILANTAVGIQAGPHLVINGPDFDTPLGYSNEDYIFPETELPKGYQSTASVELKFYENGDEIKPDTVCWTISDIQNKALAWSREPGAINGLAWGDSEVDGTTDWNATPVIGGPSITTSSGSVKLTDVVGERIVTLKAETTINGVPFTEAIDVSFGKGPLSVFAKPPSTVKLPWTTANGIAIKDNKNAFTASSTTFPAAEFCRGTIHVGSSDITIRGSGPESYSADFNGGLSSGHWRYGDKYPKHYFSITSKLPTLGQLVAVSALRGIIYSNVKRKGAAIAAGWPYGFYWSGQVYFRANGDIGAGNVSLYSGNDYWYVDVTNANPVVACDLVTNFDNNVVSSKPDGLQAVPHIVTNGPDFDTPLLKLKSLECIFPETELPKGYQSTASVVLNLYENGQEVEPDYQVCWSIEKVQNKAQAWNRESGALHGLAWGDSEVDGTTDWNATPVIGGPSITTSSGSVKLTDVVGERIVTLKAETTINGVPFTETIDVSFGKGPLSVFAKPPSTEGLPWATADGIALKVNIKNFTASSTTFPAANFCGGTVHVGYSDIIIGGNRSESYTADFSGGIISGHWRSGDMYPNQYYSITSKLPTIGQLVAVSAYNSKYNSNVKRKGAAMAAGWPRVLYWTGQVYFGSTGYFFAVGVYLADGYDSWNLVTVATSVVACVP
jgi:hypothetical protein